MENYTKIAIGVASGFLAGAILGILFAPDKGTETRAKIKKAGTNLSDNIQETINKGKDSLITMKSNLKERVDGVEKRVGDLL
jgi:gas vesicle protein